MEMPLHELRAVCDRAAADFLAIGGWACPPAKIRAAVREMLSHSKPSTAPMAWLVKQTGKMPVQAHAATRLHDLVQAIAALRAAEAAQAFSPAPTGNGVAQIQREVSV